MIYIVLVILVVPGLIIAGAILGGLFGSPEGQGKEAALGGSIVGAAVALIFFIGLTLGSSIRTVEAGHVGLVYTFGDLTGQRDAGISWIWPWQGFRTASVQVQKVRPDGECGNGQKECLEAFSLETQDVFIVATVNISINPDDIQSLYENVGPDYVNKIVRPRLLQIFKDETVKFSSVEIAPNRETIRASVRTRLQNELSDFSINVEDLLIDNLDFRTEFKQSIESKQIATQEALKAQELVAAREAEARQLAAAAQGKADALRIEAQGQAQANRLITESLTPNLIQWQAIQKLADNVEIMLLPSGEGIIIDPSTILEGGQ